MPKQTVPDLAFSKFVLAEMPDLFSSGKIYINSSYQRGDIWKQKQKVELMRSITNRYSIGVLVLFSNEKAQFEILDGQQRLLTIKQYLSGELDLSHTEIQPYKELSTQDKALLDAYCVFYLRLKSHDPDTKEEDIIQTFLRLQEGTPLNKAEKINAHRGRFKDVLVDVRDNHPLFSFLGPEKRFRLRQLAAELLTLELEGDHENKIFPALDLDTLVGAAKKYEKDIPERRIKWFKGNLDYLHNSLNMLLSGFKPSELITFYLLISHLRREKADNSELMNEFAAFTKEFLEKLNAFSMYDTKPPRGMTREVFETYLKYKLLAKKMTLSDSIKQRFELILSEYKRLHPYLEKDRDRLHDVEQKRVLYFRQRGLCTVCGKKMVFQATSAHHVIAHAEGGRTDDLTNAMLIHEKCHKRIEKRKRKAQKKE
jgi:hypothetical protein